MPSTLPVVGPDIGPITSLVRKTRLLLRGSWAITGVGLTCGLAFTALAVIAAADMLVPLVGPWLRLIGLVFFVLSTLIVCVWRIFLPLTRRLRSVEVARRIESHIPGMHSRLISCIDFAGRKREVSPAFYRKLVDESLDRIGAYRATSVVDYRAVWRSLRVSFVGVGVFALCWIAFGDKLTTALSRVFHPFADLPPASDVAFSVAPGTTKLLSGDDVSFVVTVSRGEPESLTLEIVGRDAVVRHSLKKDDDGNWRLTLRGLNVEKGFQEGFTYRVYGGRTWSKQQRIDWVSRPEIVEATVKLHFPEYLAIPEPRDRLASERHIVGPAGSRVEIAVRAAGEVAAGEVQLLEAQARYPLERSGDGAWVGSFPLTGAGHYRIELRNELGHANKPWSENPKYEAIIDQPPIAIIERPAGDLILSRADKFAITIAVRDDFGLRDLWITAKKNGESGYTRVVKVKEYATPNPLRFDTLVATLDLSPSGLNLKPGDTLRYRAEVRDRRPNSEAIASKDFSIRIADDPNSADRLLEALEQNQDTLLNMLGKLVAEQKKIKEKIDFVQTEYDSLNAKLQAIRKDAKEHAPPSTDSKDAVEFVALRKEFANLFVQEQKNVALASTLDRDWKNLALQAQKNSLIDPMINKELQDLSGKFKAMALDPLQNLASKLQQGADQAQSMPDLKHVKNQSDRVQKNLESILIRMNALANAQKGTKVDADKALAKFKDELLKEQGRITAQDLAELKDALKNLREELEKLQGKQEDLADKTDKAADVELPDVEAKQASLDELLKKELDLAKKIFEREKTRNIRRPEDPSAADPKERQGTPKKNNASTPEPKSKNESANPFDKLPPIKKEGMDNEEDLFEPALKGEREKLDPRFEKKLELPPKKKGNEADERRDALKDHQQDNLRDLDAAQKGLKSDEQTLEEMIQSLMKAAQQGSSDDQANSGGKSALDQLAKMLRSEALKSAKQMAQRARQGQQGQQAQGTQPPTGTAAESPLGNSIGAAGILDELDPLMRATILQLPSGVREELLQGMKAQGPEGYQKFIQEYFRRLADVPK